MHFLCRGFGSKYLADGAEAEPILGVTNAQLANCRSTATFLPDL